MTKLTEDQSSVYLTNLGKYTEGELIGQWLDVPCSKEKFNQALKEIGVDGVEYEEFFLTDWENIEGIGEYSNFEEINEKANFNKLINKKVDHAIDNDFRVFNEDKDYIKKALATNVDDMKRIEKLDNEEIAERLEGYRIFSTYDFLHCNSALESLGYYLLEELNFLNYEQLDDDVKQYIDVEKFARSQMHNIDIIDYKTVGKYNDITIIIADI